MKIGIIGAGAAGLVAAWLLNEHHEVTVFERQHRPGGHAYTADITLPDGERVAIDVGVAFFGDALSYPLFHRLLDLLSVPTEQHPMTATLCGAEGARLAMPPWREGKIDWYALSPRSVFDLVSFARFVKSAAKADERVLRAITLREFLGDSALSTTFKDEVVIPFIASQFGITRERLFECVAYDALKYCIIFGLDGLRPRPLFAIPGGMRRYVDALAAARGTARLRVGTAVERIERRSGIYAIVTAGGSDHCCDHVILAGGPASVLPLVRQTEHYDGLRRIFGLIDLFTTKITVHGDPQIMPLPRRRWSEFTLVERDGQSALTLWQPDRVGPPIFRSWTTFETRSLSPVYGEFVFTHSLGNRGYYDAQAMIRAIQGRDNLWFAGSFAHDNNSHESAIASAVDVAAALDPTSRNLARLTRSVR